MDSSEKTRKHAKRPSAVSCNLIKRFATTASAALLVLVFASPALAQSAELAEADTLSVQAGPPLPGGIGGPEQWTSAEGLSSAIQVMLLLTVISMAPAILLMTTCFIRVIVVLGLLRQALGTQQLPPSQVITSISLFITVLLMTPVWKQVYELGIRPYTNKEISLEDAFDRGSEPIRRFMADQIMRTKNDEDIYLFLQYLPQPTDQETGAPPKYVYYDAQEGETEVPLQVLLPAFMLSELKTAFLIGFQVYLPFVILDIVVASATTAMGMLMLPPVLISLPFKLLLFVLVDGWHLVVGMLLESFQML